jgi:hypothetical protein
MASITTLLGTDSLASSRIVLNDNFASINDALIEVRDLLDVGSQTLTLTGDVNAKQLNLKNGGANLFIVNTSVITASLPFTMEDSLILEAGLEKSVAAVSAMPTTGAYAKSAYILDAGILTGTNVVAAGNAGQEVTFIASAGVITIDPSNIAGVTAVSIANNGTLTLRFYGALWYIISYFNSTVTI